MSTFDGYFREFEGLIRADNFGDSSKRPDGLNRHPLIFLLSHAHSDHMVELESFSGSDIYCSAITKEIVLKHRSALDRVEQYAGFSSSKHRTYSHLSKTTDGSSVDLLKQLPLLKPSTVTLANPDVDRCVLTLIPANHCPGAVMFLIQMWNRAVLYTGDIRAEPWWLESLTKETILAPYLAFPTDPINSSSSLSWGPKTSDPQKPLDNLYLDTSSILSKKEVLTKDSAISRTIDSMALYPKDTIFFINAWTWGYEELLQRIAIRFKTKIHVDEYKYEIYSQPNFKAQYPLLYSSATPDFNMTRFHSCERQWRCDQTWGNGNGCKEFVDRDVQGDVKEKRAMCKRKRIVYVNPWEMTTSKWEMYYSNLSLQLAALTKPGAKNQDNQWPSYLICPLARHSSFEEIYGFVSIFKPKCIFPNTTKPKHGFIEYHALPMVFRDVIQDQAAELIAKNAAEYTKYQERRFCKRFHLRYPINSLSENLSETCDQYEKFDFGSEEYQEMWKENFLAADDSCKQSAALYVQGSITNKSKDSDYTKLSSVVSSNNPLVKSTLKRNHESSRRCSTYPIISKHKEGARMEIEGPIELLNDDDEIFNRQDKDEQCLGAHRSSAPKRLKLQNCTVKSLKAIRADVELVGNVSLQSTQGIAREPRLTELARLSQMRLKKRQAYGKTFNSSTTKTEKELFSDDFLRKRRSRVTLSINKPERQGSKGGANDRPMSREEAISLAEKNLCKLEARFNSEVSELLAELNSSTLIMTGLSKDRESLELKHLRSSEIKARSEDGWELQLILIKVLQLVKIRGAIMDTREVRHQLLS